MGARQSTPTNKRQAKTTTNIIDLNDDCLMEIFNYLDLQSLLNVGVANKWLRPAAAAVYSSQFSGKIIRLKYWDDNYDHSGLQTFFTYDVEFNGLRACLVYLRCFGSSINNLQIDYKNLSKSKRHKFVHRYINAYCADSLNEIKFSGMLPTSIGHYFVKPFPNVRCVRAIYCDLGEHLSKFVKWFPNLRHLELENVRLTVGFDEVHFQHLEYLCINGEHEQYFGASLQSAARLLQSNRQLQSLEMHSAHGKSISAVLDMIKEHSLITKLHIEFIFKVFVIDPSEINRIASEHSSLVELSLISYKFTADNVIALIDQLKSLEVFDFRIEDDLNITGLESSLDQNKWILTKRYDFIPIYVRLNRKNPCQNA